MNPLASALAELDSLLKQKAQIEQRIEAVTRSIEILTPCYPQEHEPSRLLNLTVMMAGIENLGITDAVRWALMTSPEGLAPTQVRDVLVEHGYPVQGENPMAAIHTVLKRLAGKGGGSVIIEANAGKQVYKYIVQSSAEKSKKHPPNARRSNGVVEKRRTS